MRASTWRYLEECDRLSWKFRAGRLTREEMGKFCSVFGLSNLSGFNRQLPLIHLLTSADTQNYVLFTAAGSPAFPIAVRHRLAAGFFIGSSSIATYSYTVGSGWKQGSLLELVIDGEIQGRGGDGGTGGDSDGATAFPGGNGGNGGPAIDASGFKISIKNNGAVRGGGGGGGGGAGSYGGGGGGGSVGGSGGGGGRGSPGGSAGGPGTGSGIFGSDGGEPRSQNGNPGGGGTTGGAGGGGGSVDAPNPMRAFGGTGGNGGAGGSNGADGTPGGGDPTNFTSSGGTHGNGGACTLGNSNIDWSVVGTREGALS